MNSYLLKKNLFDYVKLILLVIMFIFGLIFKATTRDYILLVVLLLIEYAFKMIFYFCYLFLIVLIGSIYIQFGDDSDRDTPGNISNPAVKSVSA